MKLLLKFLCQFRGEGCKIFFAQTDHQKSSSNHIVGFAMLIPQGAVQGQTHQLLIIVVDDGNRIIKGISGTDGAADCLLQCFQVVVDFDLFRILTWRNFKHCQSVLFLLHICSPHI